MGFCGKCGEIVRDPNVTNCLCSGNVADAVGSGMSAKDNRGDYISNAYLSSGFSSGVDQGLRRMVGQQQVGGNFEMCVDCSRKVQGNEIYIGSEDRGGHVYCEECYSKHFKKGDCIKCGEPVLGLGKEYVLQNDGSVFHKECFVGKSCGGCSKVIFGQAIQALQKTFHQDCFNCVNCHGNIAMGGPFFDLNGEPCCKKCMGEIKTKRPNITATNAITTPTPAVRGVDGGSRPYINPESSDGGVCIKCSKGVSRIAGSADVGVKLSSGSVIHSSCFTCKVCNLGVTDSKFFTSGSGSNMEFYHSACQKSASSTTLSNITCSECNKQIAPGGGGFLKIDNRVLHPHCFKCNACQVVIGTSAYIEDPSIGKPMCESCGDKFQRRQGSLKSRTGDGDEYKSKLVNSAAAAATASVHGMPVDSAASRIVGGSKEALAPFANKDSCPGCKKQAFPFDKIPGPLSTWWHKKCLSCNKCKKQLDSMAKMRAETPFCSNCY